MCIQNLKNAIIAHTKTSSMFSFSIEMNERCLINLTHIKLNTLGAETFANFAQIRESLRYEKKLINFGLLA